MSRRKRYLNGRIVITSDKILTGHPKGNRRVVIINNNPKELHVKRITKLSNGGRNAIHGIQIEIYPDIPLKSVVEDKTFKKAVNGKPLDMHYMKKTKTRLNKWDRKKLGIKK